MTKLTISKRFTFEASHILPLHQGKCSRLHGHSWGLIVSVHGPLNSVTGFVCDYAELSALVNKEVIELLDHRHLGQGGAWVNDQSLQISNQTLCGIRQDPPFGLHFYPSSENLARAIGKMLTPLIQEISHGLTLAAITIEETCTSACEWRPEYESTT